MSHMDDIGREIAAMRSDLQIMVESELDTKYVIGNLRQEILNDFNSNKCAIEEFIITQAKDYYNNNGYTQSTTNFPVPSCCATCIHLYGGIYCLPAKQIIPAILVQQYTDMACWNCSACVSDTCNLIANQRRKIIGLPVITVVTNGTSTRSLRDYMLEIIDENRYSIEIKINAYLQWANPTYKLIGEVPWPAPKACAGCINCELLLYCKKAQQAILEVTDPTTKENFKCPYPKVNTYNQVFE